MVVNRKRVQRLMRRMGIEGISPKRRTTLAAAGHRVYLYLLRGLKIEHPNQVWVPPRGVTSDRRHLVRRW